MKIYVTSKNTGPSWQSDPVHMTYLGASFLEAVAAVGTMARYEKEIPVLHPTKIYSAIPMEMEREIVKFYAADGWWSSIVSIDIPSEAEFE